MIDEGYVKYQANWIVSAPVNTDDIKELNQWREKLYKLGLIGMYNNGIGYGNISIRYSEPGQFIISGTQIGNLPYLTEQHYTKVISFDLEQNSLTCEGPIAASSESLTHAVIYDANPTVNAIIHVHHLELWKKLLDKIPTTSRDCPYGTPEMAKEMLRLFKEDNLMKKKILVMGGHEEGIISFGRNLEEAGNILLKYYNEFSSVTNSSDDLLAADELISLSQAAKKVGLSPDSLRRYVLQGKLQARKIGRNWVTTMAAVEQYMSCRDASKVPKNYRRSQ